MKNKIVFISAFAVAALTGCGGSQSPVGLVDIARLTANWPQYTNAQNQLVADERAIQTGRGSASEKRRQVSALQRKYASISNQLVAQVRNAATQVAQQKQLKLVVTHEYVGYGGADITPDVEKILGITEKATPTP